jgi:hypothetical protein
MVDPSDHDTVGDVGVDTGTKLVVDLDTTKDLPVLMEAYNSVVGGSPGRDERETDRCAFPNNDKLLDTVHCTRKSGIPIVDDEIV